MRNIILASLYAAAFTLTPQGAAHANDASGIVAQQEDGYERLYEVLMSDPGNQGARRVAEILVHVMGREGDTFAAIEAEQPGFIADMEKAMLPLVIRYMRRIHGEFRPMFVAGIEQGVTEPEAAEIADFYESDMGQVLLRASRRNIAMEATNEELLSDQPFTREDAERDVAATTEGALREIPAREMEEINNYLAARPVMMRNLLRLRGPLMEVRVAMDNAGMLPEEEAEMGVILERVLGEYGYELPR